MNDDNFYALYFLVEVPAKDGLEAMSICQDTISACNAFVESKRSHCGYRLHVLMDPTGGVIPVKFNFYMRTDVPDLDFQVFEIIKFARSRDLKLVHFAIARDGEL